MTRNATKPSIEAAKNKQPDHLTERNTQSRAKALLPAAKAYDSAEEEEASTVFNAFVSSSVVP